MAAIESPERRDLPPEVSMKLLSTVRFGRVVFSRHALPVIRPVNHVVDGDQIIIRTGTGTTLASFRQVVAYEADTIDHDSQLGWCVIVTGTAEKITSADDIDRYRAQFSPPEASSGVDLVRITADIVTGIEYAATDGDHSPLLAD
ncbi:pyridoxamine 5'-phosphate oxidase family protein [Nocardia sp. NPDC050406]|uniref:pyridoxamine 5'-phosphate oxidase family protein n=1 Tax=Nocardia sp. NPDC050406 TaxID=3364318 RepID=UPI003795F0AF